MNKKIIKDSREDLWRIMFRNEPMPEVSENAVEEFSGAFSNILPIKEDKNPLLETLYDIRRGRNFSRQDEDMTNEWIVAKKSLSKIEAEEFVEKQKKLTSKYYCRPLIIVDNVDEWLVITVSENRDNERKN